MNLDVESELAAVERTVSSLELDGQPARAVTLSRSYPTAAADLWAALTDAERIPKWFMPVSGDLKLGGCYQLEGNANGTIIECKPLSRFEITWEFGGDVSWLEVSISEDGDNLTRLTLTHTAHLSEHWDIYGPGAAGVGWDLSLLGLSLHISSPNEPKPDEAAFATSADGIAFITGSSERWGEASIAAGTESGAARAAERQTTAFYTGESMPTLISAGKDCWILSRSISKARGESSYSSNH